MMIEKSVLKNYGLGSVSDVVFECDGFVLSSERGL